MCTSCYAAESRSLCLSVMFNLICDIETKTENIFSDMKTNSDSQASTNLLLSPTHSGVSLEKNHTRSHQQQLSHHGASVES